VTMCIWCSPKSIPRLAVTLYHHPRSDLEESENPA
jgi:hypothetical protein